MTSLTTPRVPVDGSVLSFLFAFAVMLTLLQDWDTVGTVFPQGPPGAVKKYLGQNGRLQGPSVSYDNKTETYTLFYAATTGKKKENTIFVVRFFLSPFSSPSDSLLRCAVEPVASSSSFSDVEVTTCHS
jgi:hypothetical protein